EPDVERGRATAHRRVPGPPRVRGFRLAAQQPRRRGTAGAATVAGRQSAHRGRVELDPGRRTVAGRPDVAVPADRLLADVRPEHVRRGPTGLAPGERPGPDHLGLGTPDAVGRPGDRCRHHDGPGPLARRHYPRTLHWTVRREVREGAGP